MIRKLCRSFVLLLPAVVTTVVAQPAPPKNLVYKETGGSYCVGILIHTDLVLTSVRCENKFTPAQVANVGVTNRSNLAESEFINVGQEVSINSTLPGALLVKLSRPAEVTQPVEFNTEPLSPDTAVYKAGFRSVYNVNGTNGPVSTLAEQSFQVILTSSCRSIVADYRNVDAINLVTDRMVCADSDNDDDLCVDDYGGVLYDGNNSVVGFAATSDSACRIDPGQPAVQALPSVYLSAASYASELQQIICDHTAVTPQPEFCAPVNDDPDDDDSSDGGKSWCFSGRSTVRVLLKGEIPMAELEIGDQVLTSVDQETYSLVYSFGHKEDHQMVEYLQIYAAPANEDDDSRKNKKKNQPLEISAEHLLYVVKDGASQPTLVRARDVAVGDAVLLATSSSANHHQAKVQSVGTVTRRGAYAPFTTSGDIAVNGVVASNYIALPSTSSRSSSNNSERLQAWLSLEQQHWLQHAAYAPYRLYCQTAVGDGCRNETYDETTGLSAAVTWWIPVLDWLEQEGTCPRVVLTLLVFGVTLAEQLRWMHLLAAAVGYYVLVWKSGSASRRRRHRCHSSESRNDDETIDAENKVSSKAC